MKKILNIFLFIAFPKLRVQFHYPPFFIYFIRV